MAKMRAVDASMYVLVKEGTTTAFGVPGAAINPVYSAMRNHGGILHTLARHSDCASQITDTYTCPAHGNIGVLLVISRPSATDLSSPLSSPSHR
ncbi:thiamine pyrophosphate-binding protein, partial [Salmonella enterica]|uniref:thiamine pyrophosphate-binding protein n=1 Tax=Salmonella enterica TaxID=28901 RepID=UPI00398C77DB